MSNLSWWIHLPNGRREMVSIPDDYVKNVMLKVIEHEPGHIVVGTTTLKHWSRFSTANTVTRLKSVRTACHLLSRKSGSSVTP